MLLDDIKKYRMEYQIAAAASGFDPGRPFLVRGFRVWVFVCKYFVFNVLDLQGRF